MTKREWPALLLIDIQQGFDDIRHWGGQRNNPNAEKNASKILTLARKGGLLIFHVQHCSTLLTSPLHQSNKGNAFKEEVRPLSHEIIVRKNTNSAFIGTDLKEQLDSHGIKKLVIVGLTTDHCVSTTTRMAGNFGYQTYLVEDATATFNKTGFKGQTFTAELIHETAIASLKDEFATIISTDLLMENISLL